MAGFLKEMKRPATFMEKRVTARKKRMGLIFFISFQKLRRNIRFSDSLPYCSHPFHEYPFSCILSLFIHSDLPRLRWESIHNFRQIARTLRRAFHPWGTCIDPLNPDKSRDKRERAPLVVSMELTAGLLIWKAPKTTRIRPFFLSEFS